ncbi:MAG: phage holin [Staphylococcus equorum]|nr:phage holin [Tetragenococcus halophilus]MDN6572358.1 phage holin [Staphylococcus equorum]
MAESKKQPKVIGGINWSTRAKSKTFWVAIVSAIAVFANQVTGAFGVDYSTQIEQGVNIVGSILTFLAMIGVVVDNNTKGVKDSEIVQTDYVQPRDSNNPNHYVQWQTDTESDLVKIGAQEPEEFDTSQPFTDDSEDVEFDVAEYGEKQEKEIK